MFDVIFLTKYQCFSFFKWTLCELFIIYKLTEKNTSSKYIICKEGHKYVFYYLIIYQCKDRGVTEIDTLVTKYVISCLTWVKSSVLKAHPKKYVMIEEAGDM